MPSVEEIAYREGVRALEGQALDLEHIRAHISLVLTAGGVALAFFAAQHPGRGDAFGSGVVAFVVVAVMTVIAFWGITFAWDFDAYDLVNTYVDAEPQWTAEAMMREVAVHAGDDYVANKNRLRLLQRVQSIALLAFLGEIAALAYRLGWE